MGLIEILIILGVLACCGVTTVGLGLLAFALSRRDRGGPPPQ